MHSSLYEDKKDFLSIITVSFIFHFTIVAALVAMVLLKPAKEKPPPIPFFEIVNVLPPPPTSKPVTKQKAEPAPVPEPKPELKPEPKPEPKPESKPEPKPKPIPKSEPVPVEPKPVPTPSMDMPMDMPTDIKSKDMDMPAIRTLGNIMMDPQLQAYLNRLRTLIYEKFNPPAGTEIAKGTKTSIQFVIAQNGEISEVVLRSSSGNRIWDELATRAIKITKPPPLPPSFTEESLPLIFDFREK